MTVQNIQADYGNATITYSRKALSSKESYREILEQKLSQQDEVIRNGSTEKAIPLGGGAYTTEEWDEMLANFDATMDDLREQMRAEHARAYENQLQKMEEAASEIQIARDITGVEDKNSTSYADYTDFSTSKYDVIANDEFGCFEVYNEHGERVGAFFYSDIEIKTDVATGTQLLISEHGTAAYDAMILDQELILGFQEAMGVTELQQSALEGFSLNKHLDTGIQYLVKAGDEGRGGHLLINSDEDFAELDTLADIYMRDYPNLVSNKEVAQINAVLEVLGLMERTPNGIMSINRDGVSYNDNSDSEKNWALLFEGEYYETVIEFVKLHRVLGTDISDYEMWNDFFEENEIAIQRIWSDQELEQGYLNQN